jgi:N-acetylated-alpha-linked acidic dipeptidase
MTRPTRTGDSRSRGCRERGEQPIFLPSLLRGHLMIRFRFALLAALCWPALGHAQGISGFTPPDATRQRVLERLLDSLVQPASVRNDSRRLSAVPHVAGTPAQARTADYVLRQLALVGFDTARVSFRVYIPFQDSAVVELVQPTRRRFKLEEPPLREDPSTLGGIWPAMNGFSGVGDVTGAVVYANYGLPADYARLDSLGVTVRGRVVLARYGRSFRGVKAREAEAHGALALLLYSDPQQDGYFVGPTYPNGPMRHPDSPQRGSLGVGGDGDLSTPGWPATTGAHHLPQDSISGPRIPVVPLGYRNAQAILQPLEGPEVPQSWQGGLPFRYHVGGRRSPIRSRSCAAPTFPTAGCWSEGIVTPGDPARPTTSAAWPPSSRRAGRSGEPPRRGTGRSGPSSWPPGTRRNGGWSARSNRWS